MKKYVNNFCYLDENIKKEIERVKNNLLKVLTNKLNDNKDNAVKVFQDFLIEILGDLTVLIWEKGSDVADAKEFPISKLSEVIQLFEEPSGLFSHTVIINNNKDYLGQLTIHFGIKNKNFVLKEINLRA